MNMQDIMGKVYVQEFGSPEQEAQRFESPENADPRREVPHGSMYRHTICLGPDLELGFVRAIRYSGGWMVDAKYLGPHFCIESMDVTAKRFDKDDVDSVRSTLNAESNRIGGTLASMAALDFLGKVEFE